MLLRIVLIFFLLISQTIVFAQSVSTPILNSSDSLFNTTANPSVSKIRSLNTSAQHKKDTIQKKLDSLNVKVVQVQNHTRSKLDSTNQKINQSSALIDDRTKGIIQKVPVNEQVQHLDIPAIDAPNTSIPDIGAMESPDVNLPSDLKIPAIEEVPLNQPEITGLSENIPDIDGGLREVREYEGDLKKIKEGAQQDPDKLAELAEQKVSEMPVVNEATQEITKATEEQAKYEAMIQHYRDQKLIQEEIDRKYKAVANDYIIQQSEKVNAARDKLNISKYKKHSLSNIKDVFKRQSDELEGKKFYQRLVPGLNWQIYNKGFVSSDISLQIGYRLTPRLTSGIGIVYRLGFDKKFDSFVKGMNTFGGRVYADMLVVKGLFLHGEFEALRQDVSYKLYRNETVSPRVYESNFGLGKRFNITRNLRGNVIALYRLEYQGSLPINKIQVRMGIDYVFRRAKKKLDGL
jgi:hypothetical protein